VTQWPPPELTGGGPDTGEKEKDGVSRPAPCLPPRDTFFESQLGPAGGEVEHCSEDEDETATQAALRAQTVPDEGGVFVRASVKVKVKSDASPDTKSRHSKARQASQRATGIASGPPLALADTAIEAADAAVAGIMANASPSTSPPLSARSSVVSSVVSECAHAALIASGIDLGPSSTPGVAGSGSWHDFARAEAADEDKEDESSFENFLKATRDKFPPYKPIGRPRTDGLDGLPPSGEGTPLVSYLVPPEVPKRTVPWDDDPPREPFTNFLRKRTGRRPHSALAQRPAKEGVVAGRIRPQSASLVFRTSSRTRKALERDTDNFFDDDGTATPTSPSPSRVAPQNSLRLSVPLSPHGIQSELSSCSSTRCKRVRSETFAPEFKRSTFSLTGDSDFPLEPRPFGSKPRTPRKQFDDSHPGPGRYTPQRIDYKATPCYSWGTTTRNFAAASNVSAATYNYHGGAPGLYDTRKPLPTKGGQFPKANRFDYTPPPLEPGPGHYDAKRFVERKRGAFFSSSSRGLY